MLASYSANPLFSVSVHVANHPSTGMYVPITNLLSSLARKATAPATSSGTIYFQILFDLAVLPLRYIQPIKISVKSGIVGIDIISAYMVIVATELKIAATTQARLGMFAVVLAEDWLSLLLLLSPSSFLPFLWQYHYYYCQPTLGFSNRPLSTAVTSQAA